MRDLRERDDATDAAIRKLEAASKSDRPPSGDPETMPVDLPEDETERIDADAVRSECAGALALPACHADVEPGVQAGVVAKLWRLQGGADWYQRDTAALPTRTQLYREVTASHADIDSALAELINNGSVCVLGIQLDEGEPDHGQTERLFVNDQQTRPPSPHQRLRQHFDEHPQPGSIVEAIRERDRAVQRAERLEREYDDATRELEDERRARREVEDQSLSRIIETRAEISALRSDARVAQSRAIQALAEYLRDGSVSNVGRSVARPCLTGEQGQPVTVKGEPVRQPADGEIDRVEPGMDPDRLRALAFAVAAGNEAVDSVRSYVRDSLERKAFALQLTGELDDIERGITGADAAASREEHDEAAAYLREHVRRARDIVRELHTGYDAPTSDRGIRL